MNTRLKKGQKIFNGNLWSELEKRGNFSHQSLKAFFNRIFNRVDRIILDLEDCVFKVLFGVHPFLRI